MKTILCAFSLLALALLAFALPPTTARGTPQREKTKTTNRATRTDADSTRPAGGRLQADSGTQSRAGDRSTRKTTAGKAAGNRAADTKAKRDTQLTPAMEAEAIAFVDEHHRELVGVLAHLKENVPREYDRAVRELNRQRLRLKQLEGRERYDAELRLWKAQSRVRLLGARVQMGDNEKLNDALREKLAEVYDLRAAMMQRDRDRAAEKLAKLNEQLQSFRDHRERTIERQLLALTKTAQKRAKSVKTSTRSPKPAPRAKSPGKKSSTKTID